MRYCIDIDDTIFHSEIVNGEYEITCIYIDMVKTINKLYAAGNLIIIHTGRGWQHYRLTVQQLEQHGVKYHTLVMGKPVADFYVDDKSIMPVDFVMENFDVK